MKSLQIGDKRNTPVWCNFKNHVVKCDCSQIIKRKIVFISFALSLFTTDYQCGYSERGWKLCLLPHTPAMKMTTQKQLTTGDGFKALRKMNWHVNTGWEEEWIWLDLAIINEYQLNTQIPRLEFTHSCSIGTRLLVPLGLARSLIIRSHPAVAPTIMATSTPHAALSAWSPA